MAGEVTTGTPAVRGRPLSPADVRSVVFSTTRMRLGYDVEEVDAFLDQVEFSIEGMMAEIQRLRQQVAETTSAAESQTYDLRLALEQMLIRLGGPTGQADRSVIDITGRPVPAFERPIPPTPSWTPPPGQGSPAQNPRGAAPNQQPAGQPTAPPTQAYPPGPQAGAPVPPPAGLV